MRAWLAGKGRGGYRTGQMHLQGSRSTPTSKGELPKKLLALGRIKSVHERGFDKTPGEIREAGTHIKSGPREGTYT